MYSDSKWELDGERDKCKKCSNNKSDTNSRVISHGYWILHVYTKDYNEVINILTSSDNIYKKREFGINYITSKPEVELRYNILKHKSNPRSHATILLHTHKFEYKKMSTIISKGKNIIDKYNLENYLFSKYVKFKSHNPNYNFKIEL